MTAIEFSILCFPFFLLLFAVFGTASAYIGELAMDNAVAKLSRQLSTGQASNTSMSAADFRKALCAETYGLFTCSKLQIDVKSYAKYADLPKGAPLAGSGNSKTLDTSGFGYQVGAANSIMAVRVYYEWPILISPLQAYFSPMSNGSYLVGSMVAFKTEPYDAN
ncbi:TadE/TadG family type IV pilus assembly protein [Aureimonas leprariae]|nr:TadE/TadG family type IV pilus assembly protein [Aureimonas leprariae]